MTKAHRPEDEPRGMLTVRTIAMPGDTNANGDIFGGWVMSRMDQAGGIAGVDRAQGRVVTVAVDAMTLGLTTRSSSRQLQSSSTADSYSPTMVPSGPLIRWNSSWMIKSGGRMGEMALTLVAGPVLPAVWLPVQLAPGHNKPWRGHSSLTRPNKVRTCPRHAIMANLSTVAIIIVGGRW